METTYLYTPPSVDDILTKFICIRFAWQFLLRSREVTMSIERGESVMMDEDRSTVNGHKYCSILGTKYPKSELVYIFQIILVYVIVISCIANLSLKKDANTELWITLLGSSLGYILPSPKIKKSR